MSGLDPAISGKHGPGRCSKASSNVPLAERSKDNNALPHKTGACMPTIAIFNGIIIQMFFEDHNPPHIHAFYGEAKALVRILDGEIIRGSLPPRQANLVKSWVLLRQAELMENWRHAQTDGRCFRVAGPSDD